MADYKKQHIVSRRYLKVFSDRDGKVWFCNGKELRQVPFESQNQKEYFYSKESATEVEDVLRKGEELFFGKLESAEEIAKNETETALLLLLVLDLNFRNSKHENKTDSERYDSIKGILSSYIQSFFGPDQKSRSLNEILYYLSCLWRMSLLKLPENSDEQFITSDCPSVIANNGNGKPFCFLFIPISSKRALFFADKRKYYFNNLSVHLKSSEIEKLNVVTCINANYHIYSLNKPTQTQLQSYKFILTNEAYKGKGCIFYNDIRELQFRPSELTFNEEAINAFSFLQKNTNKFEIIPYKEAQEIYKSNKLVIDWKKKRMIVQGNLNVNQLYCATRAKEIDDRMNVTDQ